MDRCTSVRGRIVGALLIFLVAAPAAHASTVTMTLGTLIQSSATGATGSATLSIQDTATDQVQVTVTGNLTGIETLTGLYLNINESPTSIASLTLGTATGPAPPFSFTAGSTYATTQATVPGGTTGPVSGKYNVFIKLPNNGTTVLQGTASESFFLTGTGLKASLFDTLALQSSNLPNPDYYAAFTVTNVLGTAASGTGVFGATSAVLTTSAVPVPGALPLLLSGLGMVGALVTRRRLLA